MMRIEHLKKQYGDNLVLNDISLSLDDEVTCILGPSGAGKSTFLRCLNLLESPTGGDIKYNGQSILQPGYDIRKMREEVTMVFQHFNLFPLRNVVGNVMLALQSVKHMKKADAHDIAMEMLKKVDMADKAEKMPDMLSGGQQQRVALARMLAARPGILMFDEPFSALDSYLKSALEQNLLDVFSVVDRTVLYVSHDIDEACRLCDRICVMHNGCVEESGTAGELIARPQTLAGMRLTGCKNTSRARKVSDTVVEALDWGMTFDMGREVPDDVAYLGVRARHIHRDRARAAGELGRNSFDLHVARVSDARFERLVLLEPPLGGSRSRIQWKVDILDAPTGSLPEAGETLRLHFDASRLLLVNR